ncbi:MAG: EAL domain-containing protein [Gammaproteobacteria bacterium]|nr:EAL domain-containing protein [Gammaproteobacteria bacterium]NND47779.1 EAL domain-containing protein [Woeseiaceae bacterium]NNL46364.1 EAL domain-containing protein [Woeseiaceae bacterium]
MFRRHVGRRVLGLFLIVGLLPMLLMAYLSYGKITDGLRRETLISLRESAKSIGMRIAENLNQVSDTTQLIARAAIDDPENLDAIIRAATNRFEAIWKIGSGGQVTPLYGSAALDIDVDTIDRHHLSNGHSQLIRAGSAATPAWLLVALADRYNDRADVVAFRVSAETVWAPYEYLRHESQYCIHRNDGQALYCSGGASESSALRSAILDDDSRATLIEWQDEDVDMLSASWQLFLMGQNAFEPVDIVTTISRENIFGAVRELQAIFPLVLGLVVLLITYFSFRIVHNNLVPVRVLKNAAKEYAGGNFDARVNIETGDEFEQLGHAFNEMAGNLSQQFSLLRAMSDVDRLIMLLASAEEMCGVVLSHLSAQMGGQPCAIILQAESDATQARLLVWHDHQLDTELIVFDPHLTQKIRPKIQDEWYDRHSLSAPLQKYFEGAGFRYFRDIPISFDSQTQGVVVLGTGNKDEAIDTAIQHCRNLARRIAVGVSNAEREQALYQKTHYDNLTHLPNRTVLEDRLEQAISLSQNSQESGALLLLDLDHFKKINDLFGHLTGNLILSRVAERLLAEAHEEFTVSRLGDDEFAVVMPRIQSANEAGEFAARLLARLAQKFEANGNEHIIGASIGISIFPDDGDNHDVLIRNADAALNRVKGAGRGRLEYFSERLNKVSRRRLTLERGLRMAIDAGELRLYYQPQFDLSSGKLHGAEALLRWRHKTLGDISPAEFIPIAEQTDLIFAISDWVMDRACQDIRRLSDQGLDCRTISINVSGRQLQDHRLTTMVGDVLTKHEVNPGTIKLEITETAIANNVDVAVETLTFLRDRGVKIAMDDFGTGFSSLSYLSEMPFDYLKIDQSFVRAIGNKKNAENICRAIITMAHELGKTIIAEGIETREQESFMKNYRVQVGQGYLYSKPLQFKDFRRLMEAQLDGRERRAVSTMI